MRIELWSIYYPPEPLGIGPVAGTLARELAARGHSVRVVTSHPHYPKPNWGVSWRRRTTVQDGVEIVELPVYPRRQSALQRAGEEATYAVKQTAWSLRPSDVDIVIATVPSLLSVPGAIWRSRQGTPFVVWLQDVVSLAASHTGLAGGSRLEPMLGWLERAAFSRAERTIVISDAFRNRLLDLGVPGSKVERVFLGAPREVRRREAPSKEPTVLVIGNIGLTQNLAAFVEAFQRSVPLASIGAKLRITGDGVAARAVRNVVNGDRASYLGLVSEPELEEELARADVGLVTQGAGVADFNLPSKMITYMASGLPVFAVADPDTDLFEIVARTEAGVAVGNDDLDAACGALATLVGDRERLDRAADASLAFAAENFDAAVMAKRFERVLADAVAGARRR